MSRQERDERIKPHIDGINYHVAMIDGVLRDLDADELLLLQEAFQRIVKSAQFTLADINKQASG